MALPAGRKGVLPSELTPEGKIKGGSYTLPTASANTLGGVKVGSGLSIADGVLSADGYTLPTAAADTLGGVKVGSGLAIVDGVLSATSSGGISFPTGADFRATTASSNTTITKTKPMLAYVCGTGSNDVTVNFTVGTVSDARTIYVPVASGKWTSAILIPAGVTLTFSGTCLIVWAEFN